MGEAHDHERRGGRIYYTLRTTRSYATLQTRSAARRGTASTRFERDRAKGVRLFAGCWVTEPRARFLYVDHLIVRSGVSRPRRGMEARVACAVEAHSVIPYRPPVLRRRRRASPTYGASGSWHPYAASRLQSGARDQAPSPAPCGKDNELSTPLWKAAGELGGPSDWL